MSLRKTSEGRRIETPLSLFSRSILLIRCMKDFLAKKALLILSLFVLKLQTCAQLKAHHSEPAYRSCCCFSRHPLKCARGLRLQPYSLTASLCSALLGSMIVLFSSFGRPASRCLLAVSKLTDHSELSELCHVVAQQQCVIGGT